MPRRIPVTALMALLATALGCGSPNKANIELRKQNADLRSEVDALKRKREGDRTSLQSLQSTANSLPNLPQDRIDQLFTVHGLKLGRLTGGADTDSSQPGDEGIKVHVTPTDEDGDTLKASGAFVIEAFDLGEPDHPLIGRWSFDAAQTRKAWYSGGMLYEYAFTCPWTMRPAHPDLTIKVTITDSLTRRQFSTQKQIKITLPATTAPVSDK